MSQPPPPPPPPHGSASFAHSCLKVPLDPCSGQPRPMYERRRPKSSCSEQRKLQQLQLPQPHHHHHHHHHLGGACGKKLLSSSSSSPCGAIATTAAVKSSLKLESKMKDELTQIRNDYDSLLEFVTNVPDYRDVHELSEEQFKQRLDFLKRRQRILLKNLRFCLDENLEDNARHHETLIKCDNGHATASSHNGQIICCRRCPTPSDCKSCCNSRLSSRPESSSGVAPRASAPAPPSLPQPQAVCPRPASCTRSDSRPESCPRLRPCSVNNVADDLTLKGKACHLEESRTNSPLLYPPGSFSCLAENQDLLSYKCTMDRCSKEVEKGEKTRRNEEIHSASVNTSKYWTSESESNIRDATPEIEEFNQKLEEINSKIETKSLPPRSPKRWHPTLPKPFNFMVRDEADKYMSMVEREQSAVATATPATTGAAAGPLEELKPKKTRRKRRIRPVPLTSKIPLYDKLVAEKEQRSRIVREVSAISLMSQVRPFKLECDRRALRSLTRSSPELASCRRILSGSSRFRAKPVPKNLFSADIYDRMLENEYFRNLQKRVRAMEMMRTASLPPSMARRERRERCKSAGSQLSQKSSTTTTAGFNRGRDSVALGHGTSLPSEKSRNSAMTTVLPPRGNNLAAILRAQAAREKLEREMQDRLEEKRREQMQRLRKALTARKPAWKALRTAARHEHERDLDFRVALRRVEAHEQAERHRMQMEMMLDRVMKIPTLFERHSQSFQNCLKSYPKLGSIDIESITNKEASTSSNNKKKKKKKKQKLKKLMSSSSAESYVGSTSRPDSGSPASSSTSSNPRQQRCCKDAPEKKRPLRVSINDKAELIGTADSYQEEDDAKEETRQEREKRVLDDVDEITEKE